MNRLDFIDIIEQSVETTSTNSTTLVTPATEALAAPSTTHGTPGTSVPQANCDRCQHPLPAGLVGWQKVHASHTTCIGNMQRRIKELERENAELRQARLFA